MACINLAHVASLTATDEPTEEQNQALKTLINTFSYNKLRATQKQLKQRYILTKHELGGL
ncbi:hypothetical protein AAOGI_04130 [Agarivorans albus]